MARKALLFLHLGRTLLLTLEAVFLDSPEHMEQCRSPVGRRQIFLYDEHSLALPADSVYLASTR